MELRESEPRNGTSVIFRTIVIRAFFKIKCIGLLREDYFRGKNFMDFALLTMSLYIPQLIETRLKKGQMNYMSCVDTNVRKFTDRLSNFEDVKMFSIEK